MRRKSSRRRLGWISGAAVVTLVAAAGIAYAAIPAADGTISGCYKTANGQLRVIDRSSQSCGPSETLLEWSQTGVQGAQGLQGPPGQDGEDGEDGSTVGIANVRADGSVNPVFSKNVTSANVTNPEPGLYCFGGLPFVPRSAVATGVSFVDNVGFLAWSDTIATVLVIDGLSFTLSGCAATDLVHVRLIAATQGPGPVPVDRGFIIWFED